MSLSLYGYWRSSATYRVRIALNLKQIPYKYTPVHLVKDGGEQHMDAYRQLNPAGLVPTLIDEDEDFTLNQSLSIIEFLDEKYPSDIMLLPKHALERARVRSFAQDIACDVQPLANLRVLNALEQFGCDAEIKPQWAKHWIEKGFDVIEKRLESSSGKYCFGFDITLADIVLVPQVYNAQRFKVDMAQYPLISKIYANCNEHSAFEQARPENQPDAT